MRAGRWALRVGVVGVLLALATTASCGLLPSGVGAPVTDAAETASSASTGALPEQADPDAEAIRSTGTPVVLGSSTIWVLVTVTDGDGSDGTGTAVTVTSGDTVAAVVETVLDLPAAAGERPVIHVAGPEGTIPERLLDGSVVFRGSDGLAFAGADAPEGRVEGGSAAYYDPRDDHVAVVVPAVGGTASGDGAASGDQTASASGTTSDRAASVALTLRFSASAVASATWGEAEGGRSLAVVPTDWLRAGSLAAQEVGWSQLVARDGEVDTSTMRNQYDCHALGARTKASWNLEPWRPDVGVLEVLAARCNPT